MTKIILLSTLLLAISGCTGIEVGGRLGIYRVDQQVNSSQTNVQNKVPLKCYFVECFDQSNDK